MSINLIIPTKSALIILEFQQLTTPRHLEMSGEQKLLAYKRVGQAVNMAVDRLVTIGEIIAEGFQDIKGDMFDCCKDARDTGKYSLIEVKRFNIL